MRYCSKCGTPVKEEFGFCPTCGNEMAPLAKPATEVLCENETDLENVAPATSETVEEVKEEVCETKAETCETTTEVEAKETTCETSKEECKTEQEVPQTDPYATYYQPMPADGKGKCTAGVSLAFGLLSLLFFWVPGLNILMFVLSILGIILADAAMKHYKYGAAIAGKTFSIFALVFNLILVGIFVLGVVLGYCKFEGFAAVYQSASTQATSLINSVGKFLGSVFLVK